MIAVQQGILEEVEFERSFLRRNSLDRWRSDSGHSRQRELCKQDLKSDEEQNLLMWQDEFQGIKGEEVGMMRVYRSVTASIGQPTKDLAATLSSMLFSMHP